MPFSRDGAEIPARAAISRASENRLNIPGANGLVYTPVAPCRILDTRNTVAGAILGGQTRSFDTIAASFTAQGGSATNCNIQFAFTAIAVNLTAVTPVAPGYATAYPYLTSQPNAASINYTAGAIVNNALILQIPNPVGADDFTIFTLATADYVADVVGYFAPPVATALQCESVPDATPTVIGAGSAGSSTSATCTTGYTIVSGECNSTLDTTRFIDEDISTATYGCQVFNGAAANETLTATARCCRVPGR